MSEIKPHIVNSNHLEIVTPCRVITDETRVEQRLRRQAEVFRSVVGMRWSREEQDAEAAALECGLEAIRLLRAIDARRLDADAEVKWEADRRALLLRCAEKQA